MPNMHDDHEMKKNMEKTVIARLQVVNYSPVLVKNMLNITSQNA